MTQCLSPPPLLVEVGGSAPDYLVCLPRACPPPALPGGGGGLVNNLHSIGNQQQGPRTGSQERGRAFVSGLKSHHNVVSDQEKEQKGCGPLLCIFSSQRLPLVGPSLAGMTTGLVSSLAQENKAQGEAGGSHAPPVVPAEGALAQSLPRLGRARPRHLPSLGHLPALALPDERCVRSQVSLLPGSRQNFKTKMCLSALLTPGEDSGTWEEGAGPGGRPPPQPAPASASGSGPVHRPPSASLPIRPVTAPSHPRPHPAGEVGKTCPITQKS